MSKREGGEGGKEGREEVKVRGKQPAIWRSDGGIEEEVQKGGLDRDRQTDSSSVHTEMYGEGAPLLTAGMEVSLLHMQVASGDSLGPQSVE